MNVWFSVNKNGFINISKDEPRRNNELGKWEYYFPYINSIIYEQIKNLVEKVNFSWKNDYECITITTSKEETHN